MTQGKKAVLEDKEKELLKEITIRYLKITDIKKVFQKETEINLSNPTIKRIIVDDLGIPWDSARRRFKIDEFISSTKDNQHVVVEDTNDDTNPDKEDTINNESTQQDSIHEVNNEDNEVDNDLVETSSSESLESPSINNPSLSQQLDSINTYLSNLRRQVIALDSKISKTRSNDSINEKVEEFIRIYADIRERNSVNLNIKLKEEIQLYAKEKYGITNNLSDAINLALFVALCKDYYEF